MWKSRCVHGIQFSRSVGVFTYVLLSGVSPFLDESLEETCSNILRRDFCYPEDYFQGISAEAKDFISSLLVEDIQWVTKITWILACMSNHMQSKVWVGITYSFPNLNKRSPWEIICVDVCELKQVSNTWWYCLGTFIVSINLIEHAIVSRYDAMEYNI